MTTEHIVTVTAKFSGSRSYNNTSDSHDLVAIRNLIDSESKYTVNLSYDDEGYVNHITITKK